MLIYIQQRYPYYSQTFVKDEIEALSEQIDLKVYSMYPFGINVFLIGLRNFREIFIFIKYKIKIMKRVKSLKQLFLYMYSLFYAFHISKNIGKYDTIRTHLPVYSGLSMLVLKELIPTVKLIPVFHSYDLFTYNPFKKDIFDNSEYIETISDHNKRYIEKFTKNEVKVIRCGVRTDKILYSEKKEDFIVFAGRLHETKGIDEVLKKLSGSPYRLIIIGGGNIKKYFARAVKYRVKAEFLGKRSHRETVDIISKARICILPSRISKNGDRDGIPVIIMEAMAAGTVVLTNPISGIPEIVIDGKTGFFIRPADDLSLIEQIFNEHPKQICLNARSLIESKFNFNDIIKEKKKWLI